MGMGWVSGLLLLGALTSHPVPVHSGAVRVLRVGHNRVVLPWRQNRSRVQSLIEEAAIKAAHGGQVKAISQSIWDGRSVWMCTVADHGKIWHVMLDQHSLKPVSKILVPR